MMLAFRRTLIVALLSGLAFPGCALHPAASTNPMRCQSPDPGPWESLIGTVVIIGTRDGRLLEATPVSFDNEYVIAWALERGLDHRLRFLEIASITAATTSGGSSSKSK